MLQINGAFFETVMQFVANYGPPTALGVLGLVGVGLAWRVLYRVLSRGGSTKS
jgi:hypothetical protein